MHIAVILDELPKGDMKTERTTPLLLGRLLGAVSAMAVLWAVPALAIPPVPSSASADRVLQRQDNSLTLIPPPPEAADTTADGAMLPRPPGADRISIDLKALLVDGNSVYPSEELAALWQPQLNTTVTLDDVYAIADRITQYYRSHGYVLARAVIPQQEICCGEVRISIAEGYIGEVSLEAPFAANNLTNMTLDAIRQMHVLNITMLENRLLLLNDLPGTSFHVVLAPGQAGAVDVIVKGEKEPTASGSLTFDNSGSRYLGPYLLTGSATFNNLPVLFSETTLTASTAVERKELATISGTHTMPLGRPDLMLVLDASYTKGQPGYTLASSDIVSRAYQFGARINWQAVRQRTGSLTLSGGLTYSSSKTDVAALPFTHDEIRTVYGAVRYDWRDFLEGYNLSQLTISHGLPGFMGGSRTGDADLSRAAGMADFTKATLSLMRNQPIGQNFTLFGALSAQLANGPLLSSEEFGFGGSFIGRAYDSSEMTGESGISALLELRGMQYELPRSFTLQPFMFVDYGVLWNRDTGQPARQDGASLGAGLRLNTTHNTSAELMLAQPLITSTQSTYPNLGGPRLLFSLKAEF